MPSSLRTSLDADRVLTVMLDLPGKTVNILSSHVIEELDELVSQIERDQPRAVIVSSTKPRSFLAGADLVEMSQMTRHQLDEYLLMGQKVFLRIARLPMPVAAAINGDALGGGLELAMACGLRLCADDHTIALGMPEVKLGLVPGFGGALRLPRMIGLAPALALMSAGQTVSPREALRIGLVDAVAPRESLLQQAKHLALLQPRDHPNLRPDRTAAPSPQERNGILDQAEYEAESRSHGHYPAIPRLVSVVRAGYQHGVEAALDAERKAVLDLMEGPTAQNLIRGFFLRQSAKKSAAEQVGLRQVPALAPIKRAAVLGGGTMGCGIVHALVRAGIDTQLIEVNSELAAAGAQRVKHVLDTDVAAARLTPPEAEHAAALLHASDNWSQIDQADIVIEAVVEDPAVKREIFARLDREARADAVLASNTSSISLTELAAATSRPQRVVGIHFFNPVPRMPLVEVVRAGQSQPPALATAVLLAVRLAKAPIIANDAPGFIVNGLLIPYLCEAVRIVQEGVPIETIDRALADWGWPMGPLTLMDHIGLDVIQGIVSAMAPSRPDRVLLPRALSDAIGHGCLGRKSGRGFYIYDLANKRTPPQVNQELISLLTTAPRPSGIDAGAIQWRLMLMMANEASRVLEQHVAESSDAIDLSVLLGLGMAPFRGGIMRWCDSVGLPAIVNRLHELASALGPRFAPSLLLVDLARSNRTLSGLRQ